MEENNEVIKKNISVFLDSGLQMIFVPLMKSDNFPILSDRELPVSLSKALEEIDSYDKKFNDATKNALKKEFSPPAENDNDKTKNDNDKTKKAWVSQKSYLKYRYGTKTWHLKNGLTAELNGIWFMIETNTSGQNANKGSIYYDRGYFYQSNGLSEEEKNKIINEGEESFPEGKDSCYIDLKEGKTLDCYDKESFRIVLTIKAPNGEPQDVDVILDLGNTRTACLLFEHSSENKPFAPEEFRQLFKVLRIKPDPLSGEYESLNDVEAGVAQSWMIIHQLENQKYFTGTAQKRPSLLITEYQNIHKEKHTSGWFFNKHTEYKITGKVCQRIPQMFSCLSPVMIGDSAERAFNTPYARAMISVGAKIQQSSPKRYYWDDTKGEIYWNMLLNEWDDEYNVNPKTAASIPKLQGEMLRFIREDGGLYDFSEELEPVDSPKAYPEEPKYPRQSTLTWFLLHILERAYSQVNSAYVSGADFIPHRLRKVQITYPSGWSDDEINRYRERCQEALNIFSQTNIYHGVKSPDCLEMVSRENTPDEAVAGQLPFVFSEIIRYNGQTAAKWISLVGKKRQGTDTVRIMNFDIGGGTSDISIVEYEDLNKDNEKIAQNLLSTCLLFKDGQATGGDNLIKKLIEKIILGGLLRTKKTIPGLVDNIVKRFTQESNDREVKIIRGRIVRTCLIPLATKCLSSSGEDTVQFSPQQAGVTQNNWYEFLDFINVSQEAISITQPCFSFTSRELNEMIEDQFAVLFQNCAMYAAAYDIDMLIFSGKPSELPYIKTMAKRYIPIVDDRIIFAREFKAGQWYPFIDAKGYIKDAKTVTVVGSALYYALSKGLIADWKIESKNCCSVRNEWGQYEAMENNRSAFLLKRDDDVEIALLPNTIIARRQNICSSPEPVYKFIQKSSSTVHNTVNTVKVLLKRKTTNDGESLYIASIDGSPEKVRDYELKLWPCKKPSVFTSWLDEGLFENLQEIES